MHFLRNKALVFSFEFKKFVPVFIFIIADVIYCIMLLGAILPIVCFVLLLGVCKLSGVLSSILSLCLTLIIATVGFDFSFQDICGSVVYGGMKAMFPILFIIVMAMFSYNLLQSNGQMEIIKKWFANLVSERSILVLLITWGGGGLLEAMAGFGTAEAICVSLLVSLGFCPLFSAIVCLLGNSVITAFGAVGTPVLVLAEETGIDAGLLGKDIIMQLGVFAFLFPFVLLVMAKPERRALPEHFLLALLVGSASLLGQFMAVLYIGVEAPSIVSSLCSIAVILLYNRFRIFYKRDRNNRNYNVITKGQLFRAWSVYIFVLFLIVITSPLFSDFRKLLAAYATSHFNYSIGGHNVSYSIPWLIQGGLLIGMGTFLGGLLQSVSVKKMFGILGKTIYQLRKVFVTLVCLIILSTVMNYAGMITCIAMAAAGALGEVYPFFSPLIGCLGTFITGSGTSSNILFGKFQADIAVQLHIEPNWLAAGNMSGTTAGKMFSPQSIAVVTSNPILKGQEGVILYKMLPYALVYVCMIGAIVFCFS